VEKLLIATLMRSLLRLGRFFAAKDRVSLYKPYTSLQLCRYCSSCPKFRKVKILVVSGQTVKSKNIEESVVFIFF
jgi:hypothetical protein